MKNNNDASATTHIGPLGGDSDGDAAQHTTAESNSLGYGQAVCSNGPASSCGHSKVAHRSDAKTKSCKVCRIDFTPAKPLQTVCSPGCALTLASSKRARAEKVAQVKERRETKEKLAKLKSKAQWAREAQSAFNSFIRARDAKEPCISCGRHHGGQYHAGHYLSVGARPELRFEETNVHKQCAPCNTHLSGNVVSYRIALVSKLGLQAVDWLEGPHDPRRDTVETLAEVKRYYAAKARDLRA